jgi:hypothetical protein
LLGFSATVVAWVDGEGYTLLDVNTYGPKNNYIAFVGSNHIAQDIKTSGQ